MKLDDFLVQKGPQEFIKRLSKAKSYDEYFKVKKLSNKEALPSTRDEIIDAFENDFCQTSIHPAQGFFDGKMYYSVKDGQNLYLLNSAREIFPFLQASSHGLALKSKVVDMANFSKPGVVKFLKNQYPLDVYALYKKIRAYIAKFFVFKEEFYFDYVTLWVMGTYVFMLFRYYPYVWLNAEKNSGKTLLMEILRPIVFNGEIIISPTAAVIYRQISNNLITMLIDEVENLGKHDKEAQGLIIGILNAGYNIAGHVQRAERDGDGNFVIKSYNCFSPKMLAGIAPISNVLADRAVRLAITRKKDEEKVERYGHSDEILNLQSSIRDDLYVFGYLFSQEIMDLQKNLVNELGNEFQHLQNRELDIWEPIIILARLIDINTPNGQLVETMKTLSERIGIEKHEDDLRENDTYKILKILKAMLDELNSYESKKGIKVYRAEKVLGFFQKSEEFSWVEQTNYLTGKFKKVGIRSEQKRIPGVDKKVRMYLINEIDIKDWFERYKI